MYGINGKQDGRKYLLVKIMYGTISIKLNLFMSKMFCGINYIISIMWRIEAISKNEKFY